LQSLIGGFPVLTGLSRPESRCSSASRGSIRQPGYLHEHMFSFRPSNVATGLLEFADALLAPTTPSSSADGAAATTPSTCSAPHPHRRPLTRTTHRRPAPSVQPQPCLTPLRGAGRRAATQQAPLADAPH
jgi:hypothetical protein